MVYLIETSFDIPFKHPLIRTGSEKVNLGNCILSASPGTETVAARFEIRLENRLQHQFKGSLHYPVGNGWNSKPTQFTASLRNHPLPNRSRDEPAGFEISSQPGQELLNVSD